MFPLNVVGAWIPDLPILRNPKTATLRPNPRNAAAMEPARKELPNQKEQMGNNYRVHRSRNNTWGPSLKFHTSLGLAESRKLQRFPSALPSCWMEISTDPF